MIFPKETIFYDYDLFCENVEKFRELFITQEEESEDDFMIVENTTTNINDLVHYFNLYKKDENSCIVWKFETELKGEYSFDDLRKIVPYKEWLTFVTNFDSGIFMNTIPLKDVFNLHNPYIRTVYTSNQKYFRFDGKVSFTCGYIVQFLEMKFPDYNTIIDLRPNFIYWATCSQNIRYIFILILSLLFLVEM